MATKEITVLVRDAKEFQPNPGQRQKSTDYLCTPQPPPSPCRPGPCRPAPCRPNCSAQGK